MRARRYEVLTIEAGVEEAQIDTTVFEEARAAYRELKDFCRGRIRINGGRILKIHEADKLTFGREGWILSGRDCRRKKAERENSQYHFPS